MSELDGRFQALRTIFKEVGKISDEYDCKLLRLRKLVDDIVKPVDYSRKSIKLMKVDENSRSEVLRLIEQLSSDINSVNDLVNSFDYEWLSFPEFLSEAIIDVDRMLKPVGEKRSVFSLDELRQTGKVLDSLENGILQTLEQVNRVRALQHEVENILDKVVIFNEWVHDANHYMCRIQRVAHSRCGGMVVVDRMHSVDALVDALTSLKRDISEDLLGTRAFSASLDGRRYYEPFRLFHKFRYCYWDEGADFRTNCNACNSKVQYVRGIESLVLNIYSNAVKYLPGGSYSRVVQTSFEESEYGLEITVSSYGPVVAEDERGRLGENGFRSRAARKICRGMGQGLSRVRKVCERAGYELSIEPAPGNGDEYALFTVRVKIPQGLFLT